jgi:hypothetical protein
VSACVIFARRVSARVESEKKLGLVSANVVSAFHNFFFYN